MNDKPAEQEQAPQIENMMITRSQDAVGHIVLENGDTIHFRATITAVAKVIGAKDDSGNPVYRVGHAIFPMTKRKKG
jgi:hypothetical protein